MRDILPIWLLLAIAQTLLGLVAFYVWWPGVFLMLVPFARIVLRARSAAGAAIAGAAACMLYFTVIQWFFALRSVGALLVGGVYQGLTVLPVAAGLYWIHLRRRLPLALTLPVAWVSGEYLRVLGPLGLPTVLAVATHDQPWIIQIADITGVFGVSFAIATVSGALIDVMRWSPRPLPRVSVVSALAIWFVLAAYGTYRLQQTDTQRQPGPRVAVVQPDVPLASDMGIPFDPTLMLDQLRHWTETAIADGAELVVWPEDFGVLPHFNDELLATAYTPARAHALGIPQHPTAWQQAMSHRRQVRDDLFAWSTNRSGTIWMGTNELFPSATEAHDPWTRYNTAFRLPTANQPAGHQRKIHLFPISETVPWQDTRLAPLFEQTGLLRSFIASRELFEAWDHRHTFLMPASEHRYAVYICNEILYPDPHLRRSSSGKLIDFAIVMANDGSWLRSAANDIHFSFLPYRAVERRIAIARSANAGISAFVQPNGRIHNAVTNTQGQLRTGLGAPEIPLIRELVAWRRQHEHELHDRDDLREELDARIAAIEILRRQAGVEGISTAPLQLDPRHTFYARHGDVFAHLLWAGFIGLVIIGVKKRP